MTEYKKISVIMPVYNVEKYIGRAIESVLSQDYRNLELIVVNDGSTDNSAKIAERYSESDSRLRLVHKKNGGLSDARNFGMDHASGDYLIFIDSDDYWAINMLKPLVAFAESSNLGVALFGYIADFYDSRDELTRSVHTIEPEKIIDKKIAHPSVNIQHKQLLGYAWNKLYRTSLVRDNHLFFENGLSYIEDIIFNEKVYRLAERIGFHAEAGYHYSQRHRETLGSKYYPDMASLDLKANQAFCKSLEYLGVGFSEIDIFRNANMLEKSRWTARIISISDKINKIRKKEELTVVAGNIATIPSSNGSVVTRAYIALLKKGHFEPILLVESLRTGKLRRYISDFLPNRFKAEILYLISTKKKFTHTAKDQKKIIVTLAADYGNLGDVAITYAQKKFLSDNFKDYEVITLPISATYRRLKSLKQSMTSDDIVTIVGGGNMGDMYEDIEEQRRFIIRKFKNNKIISFPQTIDFSDSKRGFVSQKRSQKVYNSHKDLTLFAREEKSFAKMKQLFKAKVVLAPDIVLSLNKTKKNQIRSKKKVVICIRQDEESSLSHQDKKDLYGILHERYELVEYRDTHIGDVKLSDDEAMRALEDIWTSFRSADLVVTDRLHGMIFCAITGTPCIAINNSNGKVAGVYKAWIDRLSSIALLNKPDIDKFMSISSNVKSGHTFSTKYLRANFLAIIDCLNDRSHE